MSEVGVVAKANVGIRITVAAVISVFTIAAIVGYILFPSYRNILNFSSLIITASAGLYSAYYLAESLRRQISQRQAEAAFQIIERFNENDFAILSAFLEKKVIPETLSPETLYEIVLADPKVHSSLQSVLNRLESVAIAAIEGYASERILYYDLQTTVRWYWTSFSPYIRERRQSKSSTFYQNLEQLHISWAAGKYVSTGRSIAR